MENVKELLSALRNNDNVRFAYIKNDGSKRIANGTLKRGVLESKGIKFETYDSALAQKPTDDAITYWDNDANGWRRFKTANLVSEESL